MPEDSGRQACPGPGEICKEQRAMRRRNGSKEEWKHTRRERTILQWHCAGNGFSTIEHDT